MSGRGNASGPSTSRLSDQTACKVPSGTKKQCQRCRNDCGKDFMKCTVCEFVFHAKCEGISSQQLTLFRELEKLKTPFEWLCSTCRKVDVMNIMRTMHLMQTKIDNLEKEVASLKQNDPLSSVSSSEVSSQISSQSSHLSEAINEALDIKRRKMNLVISGMPISEELHDVALVQKLLEDHVLDITGTVSVCNVQRVGSKGLLIITFESLEAKRAVFKTARRLRLSKIPGHKDVFISPDLTRNQRQAEYKLRLEIKRRREEGEKGLKISKGRIIKFDVHPQSNVSTPHIIRVSVDESMLLQSTPGNVAHHGRVQQDGKLPHDSEVQDKNSSVTPGRKLPQPYLVKVGEMNVSSQMASGGSSLVASGGSSVPGGAVGTVGKN